MLRLSPLLRFARPRRLAGVRCYSVRERYAAALAAKAQKLGVSVDELVEQAQPQIETQKRSDVADLVAQAETFRKRRTNKASVAASGDETASETSETSTSSDVDTSSETSDSESDASASTNTKGNSMDLDSYIDVSKLAVHSRDEIEMLWKARFVDSSTGFSGSMTAEAFSRMYINARRYPTFVLPLPHATHGIELHYVQWAFVTSETVYCLLTSLAQYKLHGEYAQPHTTFLLHTNFVADKDIVLTNAVLQENGYSLENSALLVLNLQRFYSADASSVHGQAKLELLRKFNTGDASFTADALIEATETLD